MDLFFKYGCMQMGVYDYFKGECPYCRRPVDYHPTYGECGDIQDKTFTHYPNWGDCFREFWPNRIMPFTVSDCELVIGPTVCCNQMIRAIIRNNRLLQYQKMDRAVTP